MSTLTRDSPVQYLKGIGPAKARCFANAGIHTVGDLLEHYPFRYEDDSGEVDIADLRPGTTATVRGTVTRVRGGRRGSFTAEIHDGTETCRLRWFHRPHGTPPLGVGATVVAAGPVRAYDDRVEIVQPRVQVYPPDTVVLTQRSGARRVGVYPAGGELTSAAIRRAVLTVLAQGDPPLEEFLPAELLNRRALPRRAAAVRQVHLPTDADELAAARRRLAYEEFLLLELALALRRHRTAVLQAGPKIFITPEIDRRIRARFPFPLTAAQEAVVREICADLESGRPMTRLLQGDVGSGKTVVALYACLAAIANRRQAALMAPTETLAQQHFTNIERYLAGSRVRYVLLRGGLPRRQRAETLAAIEQGAINLVVGTQALIQKDVAFARLALVVMDEQHKFGVAQRATFRTKGPLPHYLVMTATPIPRTLALTVFGDLDVSVIRESPPGRGRTTTKVVTADQWEQVTAYVRRRLETGEQAYVVCPRIGADDDCAVPACDADAAAPRSGAAVAAAPAGPARTTNAAGDDSLSAKQAYERLTAGPWRGLNVGLLHGALRTAEKDRLLADFAAGKLHALVATTVVEVGVDVANATIMVIEHAERFGLSQLHQLRGRIGRGRKDALCVLIAHGAGRRVAVAGHAPDSAAKAAQRLAIMTRTTDGFRIAEADLQQRGPGELFGTRQHGLPELRVGDLIRDFELLEQARTDAFELVRHDPALTRPDNQPLLAALRRFFAGKLELIGAA